MLRSCAVLIASICFAACVGDAPPAAPDASAPTVARLPADHPPVVSTWMTQETRLAPVERGESCLNCHQEDGMIPK